MQARHPLQATAQILSSRQVHGAHGGARIAGPAPGALRLEPYSYPSGQS